MIAFFVRYHLSDIPEVDVKSWRLRVGGEGANGAVDRLRRSARIPRIRGGRGVPMLRQSRGLFRPHAAGIEWGYGLIGIDIGKNSFHVVGLDQRGAIVLRQKWSRRYRVPTVMPDDRCYRLSRRLVYS